MKNGFTLAEVLITLGIIGVVAAMTLPALIQNNRNSVVETRLKKFYTTFNQAIMLAEADYGDKVYWYNDIGGVELDEEGNPIVETAEIDKWFQKYFSKFIVIKKKINVSGTTRYYLSDGSAFQFGADDNVKTSRAITYFPENPDRCPDDAWGMCKFYFLYYPLSNSEDWKYHYKKGVEPCKWAWDGNYQTIYDKCKNGTGKYCTAVIQLNGWKIPKDYPRKIYY